MILTNVVVERIVYLLHIQTVQGSNHGSEIGSPD
jgi:hypothetical protein